ncbi:MAG: RnfABCDGE type electron transport complex subunit B [Oscillospiraceae bacterium]|nr:RnfABCDGE type electron transport complex subunit B [Oscillospiraceae bacterium]
MNIVLPALIIGTMGIVFGLALSYASKKFAVDVDERVAVIREILPGANCAACGYNGCDAYAAALVDDGAAANLCLVGGQALAEKIGTIFGIEVGNVELKVARVKCAGSVDVCADKYDYMGIRTCAAAQLVQEGPLSCGYGCMGFGDCVNKCAFGAIHVRNGLAEVIPSRCTACGLCVSACPKKLIELSPVNDLHMVRCMNKDRGAVTRRNCSVGCIGCMRCTTVCRVEAIKVQNNLASIDPAKCRHCGECVKVCPQRCIWFFDCALKREAAI